MRLKQETSTFANGSLAFSGQFTAQTSPGSAGSVTLAPRTGSSVADFLLGFPTTGSAAYGNPLVHYRFTQFGFYAQDDWKVAPRLTLQLGLRYEPTTQPVAERLNTYLFDLQTGTVKFPLLDEVPRGLVDLPMKQFGPRVGLAWQPGFDSRMTIRAGYGIYFDVTQLNELQFHNYGPPFYNLQNIAATPGDPVPRYVLGVNTLPDVTPPPIQPGFVPPRGTGPFSISPTTQTPTVYQWNVNIQREFPADWLLEAGYFGLNGRHLSRRYDADQCSVPDSLRCDPSVRRFPNLSQVFLTTTDGWSNYHGLHLRGERRFSHGLHVLLGFTWQKGLDTDSGGSFGTATQRTACLNCDKGPSNHIINRRFTLSVIWELPVGRGRLLGTDISRAADLLVGGWQVAAITTFQTGPAHDVDALNLAGDTGINFKRANCHGLEPLAAGDLRSNGLQYLNPANFSQPAPGFFGTCGRSVFYGPGLNNWDLAVSKNFSLGETRRLLLRTELFNAFNHAQFNLPTSSVASPIFGRIVSAQRPRVMQIAAKIEF